MHSLGYLIQDRGVGKAHLEGLFRSLEIAKLEAAHEV
jgi:hypothetical protein